MNKVAIVGTGQTKFSKDDGDVEKLLFESSSDCIQSVNNCDSNDIDGVLVSTPAGSTAYNLSVSGPILSLNSKKLEVTAISPFRPRRWKGKIVSSSSIIKIKNLNIQKRSVSAVADNFEVRNIKSIIIKNNSKIKFKLLYDKDNRLKKKIKLEQYRKKR